MTTPPTLQAVERAIRSSWSAETSDCPEDWRSDNPSRGNCGTSAFVIRDLLGGDVVVARVVGSDPPGHHAWNRFSSGFEIDVARDQFSEPPELIECEIPEATLLELFGAQAALLKSRVLEALNSAR